SPRCTESSSIGPQSLEESQSMSKLKVFNLVAVGAFLLAACAAPATPTAAPTSAPANTQAPAAASDTPAAPPTSAPAAATDTPAPAATTAAGGTPTAAPQGTAVSSLPQVPRNRTVFLAWSISSPIGVTNPWSVPGYTHQEGNVFLWEPLEYYGIF